MIRVPVLFPTHVPEDFLHGAVPVVVDAIRNVNALLVKADKEIIALYPDGWSGTGGGRSVRLVTDFRVFDVRGPFSRIGKSTDRKLLVFKNRTN